MKKSRRIVGLILFIIQVVLIIISLVLGVMCLFGHKEMIDTFKILIGSILLIMSVNNYVMSKNIKYSIIYFIAGIIMLFIGIFK